MIWTIILLFLISTLGLTQMLIQEELRNRAVFTVEEKDKLIDIMYSKQSPPTKLETTEVIHRQLSCLKHFDISEILQEKGWGWSPPPQTGKCAAVGEQCTTDFRNITENNSNFMKNTEELEKGWGSSSGWRPTQGWTSNGSISSHNTTSTSCCNDDLCYTRRCCTPTPATMTHSICTTDSHCCHYEQGKSKCEIISGLCLTTLGNNCNKSSECYAGICQEGSCCLLHGNCQAIKCTADKECCGSEAKCTDGTCFAGNGDRCGCDSNCIAPATCNDNICCSKSAICTNNHEICCDGYMCADSGSGQAVCTHLMYLILA